MGRILFKAIGGRWVLNIPAGHPNGLRRVFVTSRGRILKSGKFNNWLPCGYFLTFTADDKPIIAPPKPLKKGSE